MSYEEMVTVERRQREIDHKCQEMVLREIEREVARAKVKDGFS